MASERSVTIAVSLKSEPVSEYVKAVERVQKAKNELMNALEDLNKAIWTMSETMQGEEVKS